MLEGVPNGPVVAAKIAQLLGLAEGSATADGDGVGDPPLPARRRPARGRCVVLVDDIHWAEPALLDLLAGLPAAIADAPILAALPRSARAARDTGPTGR